MSIYVIVNPTDEECRHVFTRPRPNPERFGGPEVDDELEFRRLFDRQICGLRALQDLVDETRNPSPNLHQVCAV